MIFFKDKNNLTDGRYSICKKCKHASTYKWREENKETYNESARKWRKNNPEKEYGHEIKRRYGIDLSSYNEMLKEQNNGCKICGKEHNPSIKRGRLYVDHDHKTNKVRGLLCGACNSAIGYFEDNIETLQKAIDYLNKHK